MRNLHIALIMDSSNQEFSVQCESNPALYKKCSVLWMEGWARDTMIQVGGGSDWAFLTLNSYLQIRTLPYR